MWVPYMGVRWLPMSTPRPASCIWKNFHLWCSVTMRCRGWEISDKKSTFREPWVTILSIHTYIYIHLEPNWPLFLKVNPPKEGPFHSKQGSFGFQVYILTTFGAKMYSIVSMGLIFLPTWMVDFDWGIIPFVPWMLWYMYPKNPHPRDSIGAYPIESHSNGIFTYMILHEWLICMVNV